MQFVGIAFRWMDGNSNGFQLLLTALGSGSTCSVTRLDITERVAPIFIEPLVLPLGPTMYDDMAS